MKKTISELKREKRNLEDEKQRVVQRFNIRIAEIQTAIDNSTNGAGDELLARKARNATEEVYRILAVNPPLYVDDILLETNLRGWKINRQSISSLLSTRAKRGELYKRVAPNTYTLIDKESAFKTAQMAG